MATPSTREASDPRAAATVKGKVRRRPPSQAEQERRKAWGHKYGPLAAAAIKQGIERMEKR